MLRHRRQLGSAQAVPEFGVLPGADDLVDAHALLLGASSYLSASLSSARRNDGDDRAKPRGLLRPTEPASQTGYRTPIRWVRLLGRSPLGGEKPCSRAKRLKAEGKHFGAHASMNSY